MEEDRSYYVYEHVRLDNGATFYVGKGHNGRAWDKGRNSLHDEIAKKYGCKVNIVKSNLTEKEAYDYENTYIKHLMSIGYGIDVNGFEGNDSNKKLTNKTFGGRGCIGESNPMYGISPKERMSEEQYKIWYDKTQKRLHNQYGKNNPNYKNDTLHNKVKDSPDLRIKYYSRPGAQNGRSKKIKVYDINHNYIATFDYIGECCEWIKKELNLKATIDSIRSNVSQRSKKGLPYRNHYFEIL